MEFTSTKGVITRNRLQELVPSIFTTEKKSGLTKAYNFVPTFEVVREMDNMGWLPVKAEETRCRDDEGRGFQKHMVRFRNFDESLNRQLVVGDTFVEIVLCNSHNGLSSFIFNAGLYRLACGNGLVISEGSFSAIHIRHNSYEAQKILDVCAAIVNRAPMMGQKVNDMKQILLTADEKKAFATAAKVLRFDDPKSVHSDELLRTRRYEDKGDDLWKTMNVVQENVIKGNVRYTAHDKDGRPQIRHSREVKAIDKNMKLNQAIWTLAEEMAKIKKQNEVD